MFSSTNELGRWQPGIGDPTLMGWLTVLAYFAAAWLCWRALHAVLRAPRTMQRERWRLASFWWVVAVLLFFLGINKQLDLQSLFTQIARDMSVAQGWYERRREYQVAFIVGVAVTSFVMTVGAGLWLRHHLRDLADGLLGLALLVGFVAIRAASFHHVDTLLRTEFIGVRFNWLMEIGAIALIAYSALRQRNRLMRRQPRPRRAYDYRAGGY